MHVVRKTTLALPEGVRLADIIAKVARVHIRDTVRVMNAVHLLSEAYGISASDTVKMEHAVTFPSAQQASRCEDMFLDMCENPWAGSVIAAIREKCR